MPAVCCHWGNLGVVLLQLRRNALQVSKLLAKHR